MSDEREMGIVVRENGRVALRFQRRLAHPPAKVWRALTESEHLRHWLPCDIVGERAPGAVLELPFWPAQVARYGIVDPVLTGRIREWSPPAVFEWTWDRDVLRWELEAVPGGTLLTFTVWVGDVEPDGLVGAAAGYHVCLDQLVELLDTGAVERPLVDRDVAGWEQSYRAALAADGGSR